MARADVQLCLSLLSPEFCLQNPDELACPDMTKVFNISSIEKFISFFIRFIILKDEYMSQLLHEFRQICKILSSER